MSYAQFTVPRGSRRLVDLATFLDEGGDLARFPLLDALAQAVVVERPRQSEAERRLVAQWCREQVDAWLGGEPADHATRMSFLPRTPEFMTALLWQADCLEDPGLASRLEGLLPLRLRAKYRRATARANREVCVLV